MLTASWKWFRFSLTTLLAVPFTVGVLLAWWRMPFTITRASGDGYRQTVVRREWDGSLSCHGQTTIYYVNGQKCLEYSNYDRFKAHCTNDYLMPDLRCWDRDGREMSIEEAFERRGISKLLPIRAQYSDLYGKRPALPNQN